MGGCGEKAGIDDSGSGEAVLATVGGGVDGEGRVCVWGGSQRQLRAA